MGSLFPGLTALHATVIAGDPAPLEPDPLLAWMASETPVLPTSAYYLS